MQADALDRLAAIADAMGNDRVAGEARDLAARAAEGRFHLVCVGQFKRGKSTVLDALVADRVLPTGIVPVTSVPTVIRYGPRRTARVRLARDAWREIDPDQLEQYVSEECNPENRKGVAAVEVLVPAALLETGMTLVDTPGLGSVHAGNTMATQAFVPQIDAALVVIGADPPLSGEELTLVETIAREVQELIFVLNKADRNTDAERAAAAAFARRQIEGRLGRPIGPIFDVSAVEQLEGRGPPRDWPALVHALHELVQRSGRTLSRRARDRGTMRLTEELLRVIAVERAALLRPIEESNRRIAALDRTIAQAEQMLDDLGYRLGREQQHLRDLVAGRREAFLARAEPDVRAELSVAVRSVGGRWGPALRRALMDRAIAIARRHVLPWLAEEQAHTEDAYRRVSDRFVELARDFLARLEAAGDAELAHLSRMLDGRSDLGAPSRFAFHELLPIAHPASPLRYGLDVLTGLTRGARAFLPAADDFTVRLLVTNASRVQGDLDERVLESRRQLEAFLRRLLRGARDTADHALVRARSAHAAGAAAVEEALARLAAYEHDIRSLQAGLPTPSR